MGHAAVENTTPFTCEALFLVDEEYRSLVVPVIKATLTVAASGTCLRAAQQLPLSLGGELYGDVPETSSYKYEPEVAFFKCATDVVMIGHACAQSPRTTEMNVSVAVGPLQKSVRVFGDRTWQRRLGSIEPSAPATFEKMPLIYERAFGGSDASHPDPSRHALEARNPVGAGFRVEFADSTALPNLEDPAQLLRKFEQRPAPACFGFVSPHWQPRARLAGTFDDAWHKARSPLLPRDFDRRHFSAASPGLVAPGYLRGDEQVTALGVNAQGSWSFALPGLVPPKFLLARRGEQDLELDAKLDTLILEPDAARIQLLWRAHAPLKDGPHSLKTLAVSMPDALKLMAAEPIPLAV